MQPTVSVIIVNWNGLKFLPECLGALKAQVYSPFRVILVDNGSSDGSVEYVRNHFPEITIICLSKNTGFTGGNNVALKQVTSDYVALLNNDTIAHPDWLANLVAALERRPKAGFAASKMVFQDNPQLIDRVGDAYTTAGAGCLRGRNYPAHTFTQEEWIFGACAAAALYRTSMLRDIGHFDDDFFLLYEDLDLSFRAQLNGYQCLYVPSAIVQHKGSSSIVTDSAVSVYYGHRNLEWIYIKNMPSRLLWRTLPLHLSYDTAAFFFFLVKGRGKAFIRAKIDALKSIAEMLAKRRGIQAARRVDDQYIWNLFEKERTFMRWRHRRRRRTGKT